ncbi:hypothetical protein WJX72_003789 [[Myrmecia] bisecta]|uniref:Uncharacterized protein n=1 Tax=[Myrmecia] bisecta TaxID=41462 RepID=A0AAW1QB92_9CHLO
MPDSTLDKQLVRQENGNSDADYADDPPTDLDDADPMEEQEDSEESVEGGEGEEGNESEEEDELTERLQNLSQLTGNSWAAGGGRQSRSLYTAVDAAAGHRNCRQGCGQPGAGWFWSDNQPGAEKASGAMRDTALPLDMNPALASHLARFDILYVAHGENTSQALYEARCEVAMDHIPSGGMIAPAGDRCVWTGGSGWKQREPLLMTWKNIGREHSKDDDDHDDDSDDNNDDDNDALSDSESNSGEIQPGFYEPAWHVVTDPVRDLIWAHGDARIKGFDWDGTLKYTLYAPDACSLLQLGDKVYAGSKRRAGTLAWWDMTRVLQQTNEIYAGELEENEAGYGSDEVLDWRDQTMIDDIDEVEVTRGHKAHGLLKLGGALGAGAGLRGGKIESTIWLQGEFSHQVALACEHRYGIRTVDFETQQPVTWLLGHTSDISQINVCQAQPWLLASASLDGSAKLWDLRSGLCTLTLQDGADCPIKAVAPLVDAGQPFCFTGGTDESVKCWDVRAGRCLYELSTGNNSPTHMLWLGAARTLLVSTECIHIDRLGCGHGYETEDEDGEERWPDAHHNSTDFKHRWDAAANLLIRYQFKDKPDLDCLPGSGCAGDADFFF